MNDVNNKAVALMLEVLLDRIIDLEEKTDRQSERIATLDKAISDIAGRKK